MPETGWDPTKLVPMNARLTDTIPASGDWIAEFKLDGMRALFSDEGSGLRILSRNGRDITRSFPEFSDVFFSKPGLIDGEIVAPDLEGTPDFHLLQRRIHNTGKKAGSLANEVPALFIAFDILKLGDTDIMGSPFRERRRILEENMPVHPRIKLSVAYEGDIKTALDIAREKKLEGLVLKKADSIYKPGTRSGDWLKIKFVGTADLIIGGWRPRSGSLNDIGSMLLGAYDEEERLHYLGSVGTGMDGEDQRILGEAFGMIPSETSPFVDQGKEKGVRYLLPRLVAEVEYRRWPEGGKIEQTSYKGLRPFKDPKEVTISGER